MTLKKLLVSLGCLTLIGGAAIASTSFSTTSPDNEKSLTIPIYFTAQKGTGEQAGEVLIQKTDTGLLFSLNVHGLAPGVHAFHIDENPSCDRFGLASGDHLDPTHSGKHLGPYNKQGHLGDLPELYVANDGNVPLPILAPRIFNLNEIKNHALVISKNEDSKQSKEIVACAVIKDQFDL